MYLGIIKSFTPVVLLLLWGKCECHMLNRQSNKKTQKVFACSFLLDRYRKIYSTYC